MLFKWIYWVLMLKFFFIEICLIKYEFNKVFKIGNDLEEILWLKMSYLI